MRPAACIRRSASIVPRLVPVNVEKQGTLYFARRLDTETHPDMFPGMQVKKHDPRWRTRNHDYDLHETSYGPTEIVES